MDSKFLKQKFQRKQVEFSNQEIYDDYFDQSIESQNSSFQNDCDDSKLVNDLIDDIYVKKSKEIEPNFSYDSAIMASPYYQTDHSLVTEPFLKNANQRTSILKRIKLPQKDSIENISFHSKQLQSPRNMSSVKQSTNSIKTIIGKKKNLTPKKNDNKSLNLPQIWKQYQNKIPQKQKEQATQLYQEIQNQFQEMDKVFEPFLKDQKVKVNLINPLIIRKDKPYYVAQNKHNKNLIDNMKQETSNLTRDEYLIVGYDKISKFI